MFDTKKIEYKFLDEKNLVELIFKNENRCSKEIKNNEYRIGLTQKVFKH